MVGFIIVQCKIMLDCTSYLNVLILFKTDCCFDFQN